MHCFLIISKLILQVVNPISLRPSPLPILSMAWIRFRRFFKQNFRRP